METNNLLEINYRKPQLEALEILQCKAVAVHPVGARHKIAQEFNPVK